MIVAILAITTGFLLTKTAGKAIYDKIVWLLSCYSFIEKILDPLWKRH